MWNIRTPQEAKDIIASQIAELGITEPQNLEEQALSLAGKDVYEKLVKGYTEKQWGRDCKELPAFIIKRLPLRFTYDNNYFNDRFQGIPMGGYTQIVEKMLDGIDVVCGEDFFDLRKKGTLSDGTEISYDRILFTGQIDEYFDSKFGPLEYRSVRFETEKLDMENYQGNAVVNYTEREVPYTRIIEHKHFEFGKQPTTIISREYSSEWKPGVEPYYPVNNDKNNALYEKYAELAKQEGNVIFGGRLGQYKYYDMDKVLMAALECVEEEL
jgi:UDP-galactopyranose mutase